MGDPQKTLFEQVLELPAVKEIDNEIKKANFKLNIKNDELESLRSKIVGPDEKKFQEDELELRINDINSLQLEIEELKKRSKKVIDKAYKEIIDNNIDVEQYNERIDKAKEAVKEERERLEKSGEIQKINEQFHAYLIELKDKIPDIALNPEDPKKFIFNNRPIKSIAMLIGIVKNATHLNNNEKTYYTQKLETLKNALHTVREPLQELVIREYDLQYQATLEKVNKFGALLNTMAQNTDELGEETATHKKKANEIQKSINEVKSQVENKLKLTEKAIDLNENKILAIKKQIEEINASKKSSFSLNLSDNPLLVPFYLKINRDEVLSILKDVKDPILKLKFIDDFFNQALYKGDYNNKFFIFNNIKYSRSELKLIKELKEAYKIIVKEIDLKKIDEHNLSSLNNTIKTSKLVDFNRSTIRAFIRKETSTRNFVNSENIKMRIT